MCRAFFGAGSSSLVLTGMAAHVCRDLRRSVGESNVGSRGIFLRCRRLRKMTVLHEIFPSVAWHCGPLSLQTHLTEGTQGCW